MQYYKVEMQVRGTFKYVHINLTYKNMKKSNLKVARLDFLGLILPNFEH